MEVLGTKNGRNESIEGHKENSRGVYATVRKKKDGNITSVIAFMYWLLPLKLFSDYCY